MGKNNNNGKLKTDMTWSIMGCVIVELLGFTSKNTQRSHKRMSIDFLPPPVIFWFMLGSGIYKTFETRVNNMYVWWSEFRCPDFRCVISRYEAQNKDLIASRFPQLSPGMLVLDEFLLTWWTSIACCYVVGQISLLHVSRSIALHVYCNSIQSR